MSDAPFLFSSFYVEYLAQFMFVAIAYLIGGLLVPWLFKGPKTIFWSWSLCMVLLVFSPVPFGNASITDVGLSTKLYFLASVNLPLLVLGLVASVFIALRIRRGVQDHGFLKYVLQFSQPDPNSCAVGVPPLRSGAGYFKHLGIIKRISMLHKLHRASACVIGAYVAVHLFNHLLALRSVEAHIQFMGSFRHIYRNPFVEALLLACVTFQIGSGIYFIKNPWGERHGFFEQVQALSGGYLAFFLLVHVGAVLFGRAVLQLDTNFYYAAAGMHVSPFQYYFVPYYFWPWLLFLATSLAPYIGSPVIV